MSRTSFSPAHVARMRRTRRHPRRSQFDYLHVQRLVDDLRATLGAVDGQVRDVLDIYCGTRPYDDLSRRCALRRARRRGQSLRRCGRGLRRIPPVPGRLFDLVTCYEAFHYVQDPGGGIAEIRRVLRSGGTVIIAVPFVWEYDRTILEHRFTGPELETLLEDWEDVRVVENGGRAIAWATLTGSMLERARCRAPRPMRALFPLLYLALNGCGSLLDTLEQRTVDGAITLPMNLLVTARRPRTT